MKAGLLRDAFRVCLGALAVGSGASHAQDPNEVPKEIIAVQIRKQGYACDAPKTATREPSTGNPDDRVWILECENARYRVHLTPDMAARVERLK